MSKNVHFDEVRPEAIDHRSPPAPAETKPTEHKPGAFAAARIESIDHRDPPKPRTSTDE